MKKIMLAVMMSVMLSNVAFGATLGEYEKNGIVMGTYEVVDITKKATLSEWSEPDLFGNQYRLYEYTANGTKEIVCLKHHCSKKELKEMKAARK